MQNMMRWSLVWGVLLALGLGSPTSAQDDARTVESFLAESRNATLATIRVDGTPQLTPVWFVWDGERFMISMTSERAKYKNLARDPRMSLCIDDVKGFGYVTAEGKAEIRDTDIWADTKKILVKYRGEEGGAAYLETLKSQPRVLVVMKPTRMETLGLAK